MHVIFPGKLHGKPFFPVIVSVPGPGFIACHALAGTASCVTIQKGYKKHAAKPERSA
jgi:hypothetical protein